MKDENKLFYFMQIPMFNTYFFILINKVFVLRVIRHSNKIYCNNNNVKYSWMSY